MTHFGKRIMGVVAALAAAALVAACTASPGTTAAAGPSGAIGSVPPAAAGPQHAGTITWAMRPGATPNWILPINTGASFSLANVHAFQWLMWRPLYWNQNGTVPEIVPSMSLAESPVWSDGGKTLSITMKSTYKWSDGHPITSKDLLFDLNLIKAAVKKDPSNWPAYVPGHFPDNLVSASTPNDATLILNLAGPVNPSWFQQDILSYAGVNPLPSHAWAKETADGPLLDFTDPANAAKIYDFLIGQAKSLSTYATNPLWQIVSGPYRLSAFNPVTGAFTMTPNPSYGGPRAERMSSFEGVSFTSSTAVLNALKTGSVDVGNVDLTAVPQIPSIESAGYRAFGMPAFGSNFMAFNYKNTTGHFGAIASQLYFRQVMAHLVNQQGYIKAFMHGAGVESYGPIPTYPKSPYLPQNATVNPYPFSITEAINILKAHGWKVNPGGTTVCERAGTGPDECGAGIPAGTPLAFNLIYASSPSLLGAECAALASDAKQAGIDITLASSSLNYMIEHYSNVGSPADINQWAMQYFGPQNNNPYPTQYGFLNTGGSFQIGDYSNPTADRLINESITSSDPQAVKNEAAFLTTDVPVLWLPNPHLVWAWKTSLSGEPASFENLTQYYVTPEFWYFTK